MSRRLHHTAGTIYAAHLGCNGVTPPWFSVLVVMVSDLVVVTAL